MSLDRGPIDEAVMQLVANLEEDRLLLEPQDLRRRIQALDELEGLLSHGGSITPALWRRAARLQCVLEARNSSLYSAIRRKIQRGEGERGLTEWVLPGDSARAAALGLRKEGGYDYLDDLIAGVLMLEEPETGAVPLEPEMVPYQPTPARQVFDFIERAALTEKDVLIDLGSGLGHVTLLAAICTRAECVGIEVDPGYVESARRCAAALRLNNAKFVESDVRTADFCVGSIFYLYTPFRGTILRHVLNALRCAANERVIRVCTYGPCTKVVAAETWLGAVGSVESEKVAIFRSSSRDS